MYVVFVIGTSLLSNGGSGDATIIIATLAMVAVGLIAGMLQNNKSRLSYALVLPFMVLTLFFFAGSISQHDSRIILGYIIILLAGVLYFVLYRIGIKIRGVLDSRHVAKQEH